MSNNAYDRQKLPHEDDVAFERVLRNISRQEVMPRPMVVGPTEIGRTSHSDLFGDIYHWDNFSLANTVYLFLKYLIELGIATISLSGVVWISQPFGRPLALFILKSTRIVKYTLLMDPPVPDRYSRMDMMPINRSIRPYFSLTFKNCLRLCYKYFFLRMPVFTAGSWVGSKMVWALEDVYGEDAMLSTKYPIMVGSGFAALFIKYARNDLVKFARAPLYSFAIAFSVVWMADVITNKRGIDALWNPLHLRLPSSVVSVLAGDPFNGEFVLGPLKYAAASALNTVAIAGHSTSRFLATAPENAVSHFSKPSVSAAESYSKTLESRISYLEEESLIREGYLQARSAATDQEYQDLLSQRQKLTNQFESSAWNVFGWFSSNDRLSQSSLGVVNSLFSERPQDVVTPTGLAKSPTETIFGNLLPGIEQSKDAAYVKAVSSELETNASSSNPKLLGIASEAGFFATQRINSQNLLENAIVDPVGWLLSPLVSLASKMSTLRPWSPHNPFFAFDDRSTTTQAKTSLNAPLAPGARSGFEGEKDLPTQYDLPPIIPPEAAERQAARIQETRQRVSQADDFQLTMVKAEVAVLKAGVAIKDATAVASDLVAEVRSELTTPAIGIHQYADMLSEGREGMADSIALRDSSDDDFMDIIRASIRQAPAELLPEGVTAEERLKSFVESVGGRDFEEPTETLRAHKMPYGRSSRSRNPRFAKRILGERRREHIQEFKAAISEGYQVRAQLISDAISGVQNPVIAEMQRQSEYEASLRRHQLEKSRSQARERLEREYLTPARKWFNDFTKRWTGE